MKRFSVLHSNKRITPHDLKLFRNTWETLRRNMGFYGVTWLLYYFGTYPQYLRYHRFKVHTVEELKSEPSLTLHALKLMRQFSIIADFIDKPEMLFQILNLHVAIHAKRNIEHKAYDDLKTSLMVMLTRQLKVSGEVLQAWDKVISLLFDTINEMNDNMLNCK